MLELGCWSRGGQPVEWGGVVRRMDRSVGNAGGGEGGQEGAVVLDAMVRYGRCVDGRAARMICLAAWTAGFWSGWSGS